MARSLVDIVWVGQNEVGGSSVMSHDFHVLCLTCAGWTWTGLNMWLL